MGRGLKYSVVMVVLTGVMAAAILVPMDPVTGWFVGLSALMLVPGLAMLLFKLFDI